MHIRLLYFTKEYAFLSRSWIPLDVDSILNDFAMMLVFKQITLGNVTSETKQKKSGTKQIAVVPSCAIDSHAYDDQDCSSRNAIKISTVTLVEL